MTNKARTTRKSRNPSVNISAMLLEVVKHSFNSHVGINPMITNPSDCHRNTNVYFNYSGVVLETVSIMPPKQAGSAYHVELIDFGSTYSKTVGECMSNPAYLKSSLTAGSEDPTHDVKIPESIGYINRRASGENFRIITVYVPRHTIDEMLLLLPHVRPLYLTMEIRIAKGSKKILGISIHTEHPGDV